MLLWFNTSLRSHVYPLSSAVTTVIRQQRCNIFRFFCQYLPKALNARVIEMKANMQRKAVMTIVDKQAPFSSLQWAHSGLLTKALLTGSLWFHQDGLLLRQSRFFSSFILAQICFIFPQPGFWLEQVQKGCRQYLYHIICGFPIRLALINQLHYAQIPSRQSHTSLCHTSSLPL